MLHSRVQAQGERTFHGMVVVPLKENGLIEPAQLCLEREGRGRGVEGEQEGGGKAEGKWEENGRLIMHNYVSVLPLRHREHTHTHTHTRTHVSIHTCSSIK